MPVAVSESGSENPDSGTPSAGFLKTDRRRRHWPRGLRSEERWLGFGMIAPIIALLAVFGLYPFARTIQLSVTDWDGLSSTFHYVGGHNYLQAFHDRIWWQSMEHGLIFAAVALTLMQGLGLLLALGVDQKIRGQSIYRVLYYLPPVLSGIVVAIVWKWLYQPYGGPINEVLKAVGLAQLQHPWLGDGSTALWAVSLASVWQGVGTPFLLFLAALQNVREDLCDAARVDGATRWQLFRNVTLPSILPTIGLVSVLTFLGAMQMFNMVLAMTNGGPGYATEVPVLHIFRAAFELSQFGYATALAVLFGFMLFIISLLTLRLTKRPV
jgi:ABC-type sugar transport system permease subunit